MTQNKNPNKRMVYIRPENLEFYESLTDKSEFINEALAKARLTVNKKDHNVEYVRNAVAKIDERSKKARA